MDDQIKQKIESELDNHVEEDVDNLEVYLVGSLSKGYNEAVRGEPPIVARKVIQEIRQIDYPSVGSDLSEEAEREKERRRNVKEFFSDIDGVGRQTKRKIIREFGDLTSVYNDVVRNDGEGLKSIRNITDDVVSQIEEEM